MNYQSVQKQDLILSVSSHQTGRKTWNNTGQKYLASVDLPVLPMERCGFASDTKHPEARTLSHIPQMQI
jgi:hypothetical protein